MKVSSYRVMKARKIYVKQWDLLIAAGENVRKYYKQNGPYKTDASRNLESDEAYEMNRTQGMSLILQAVGIPQNRVGVTLPTTGSASDARN